MPPSRQAIAAVSTGDVTFADDEIALCKSFDVVTHSINDTSELVTDGHWHWNRFLRPVIPVVDVHVGAAYRRLQNPDQHVIAADVWNRNILQPETWLCFRFDNRLHHFLHAEKLGESRKTRNIFATRRRQNKSDRLLAAPYKTKHSRPVFPNPD